jgi:hypothetical protein
VQNTVEVPVREIALPAFELSKIVSLDRVVPD